MSVMQRSTGRIIYMIFYRGREISLESSLNEKLMIHERLTMNLF